MKVLILGASGIIGQHMRLCVPEDITPIWTRQREDFLHKGLNLADRNARVEFLNNEKPDVIVNLAGESRPDAVQFTPEISYDLNVCVPEFLAGWCDSNNSHYVHISTQAVFEGNNSPYSSLSPQGNPVNEYGIQKQKAEHVLEGKYSNWTIIRPTFVLGVRPIPTIGRQNPIEQMLENDVQYQVNDRFFSISFAWDVADAIWDVVKKKDIQKAFNVGNPLRICRYELAKLVNPRAEINAVSHNSLKDLAPRPLDTTYTANLEPYVKGYIEEFNVGISRCIHEYNNQRENLGLQRASEISIFTGKPKEQVVKKLMSGFGILHNEVTQDFKKCNPKTDEELLNWYRNTESYIWELTAYHLDAGFNYFGMCKGISDRLLLENVHKVLCLGDGIGDLTLYLRSLGFDAHYHDLAGSKTFDFAKMRSEMYLGKQFSYMVTEGFHIGASIDFPKDIQYDAIVSLDFLEHVPNVPDWVQFVHAYLRPNGLFCAQNAFNIGSGESGSMPMHLAVNDKYEKEWDTLLNNTGFKQLSSNWYRKV